MAKKQYRDRTGKKELDKAVHLHDKLTAFENFCAHILPALRYDIKSGLNAEALYKKYQAYAAARGVTIAMTSADEGKALQAVKDILDRAQGKAVERHETKHKFDDLTDEELDAMVMTKLKEDVEVKTQKQKNPVKALSREQKLAFLDALEEQHRRSREQLREYDSNEGQTAVHYSLKTVRCVFSGNGAGKTALGANEAIWAARGYSPVTDRYSPVPCRVIVLLDHPDKVADVWLPELRKWGNIPIKDCHKRGKPYYTQITFRNGSEILFMFHQQEPMVFESIEFDYLIADEPPPRHVYIALRRGGRKRNRTARFLLLGTPITGAWMRIEIYEPWTRGELPDTECFKFGTIVNEANLAEDYIESFSRVLSDKEKRIRLHGDFFDLDGLALAHLFDRKTHVIAPFNWPSDNPVVVAIDPHSAKPHHAVLLGADSDDNLYLIKEISCKVVARDFARTLKQWYQGYSVIDIVCDCLGSSEYTSGEGFKSFIQVLNEEGVRARATTWTDKSDEDFIERIKDNLSLPNDPNNFGEKIPKLRVFSGNNGIIRDIENVQWVKIRNQDVFKPKLDITNKDFLACLKYALATSLTHMKKKSKIYRRTQGAETYGIDRAKVETPEHYIRKLGLRKKPMKPRKKKEESWEDF